MGEPGLGLAWARTRLRGLLDATSQPEHLYGSLEAHLVGTADLLAGWRAALPLCLAGLFHAAYSTGGRAQKLLDPGERCKLAGLIGAEAEQLVYLYCACDRDAVYPALRSPRDVIFRDRFCGRTVRLRDADASALCMLTVANELELMSHGPAHWRAYGDQLRPLFANAYFQERLSAPARLALAAALAAADTGADRRLQE